MLQDSQNGPDKIKRYVFQLKIFLLLDRKTSLVLFNGMLCTLLPQYIQLTLDVFREQRDKVDDPLDHFVLYFRLSLYKSDVFTASERRIIQTDHVKITTRNNRELGSLVTEILIVDRQHGRDNRHAFVGLKEFVVRVKLTEVLVV